MTSPPHLDPKILTKNKLVSIDQYVEIDMVDFQDQTDSFLFPAIRRLTSNIIIKYLEIKKEKKKKVTNFNFKLCVKDMKAFVIIQ